MLSVRVSRKCGLQEDWQRRVFDSAHRLAGQLGMQVQLPVYPKVGGLAGQTSTQRLVRLSAKAPPVQVDTQNLLVVRASP